MSIKETCDKAIDASIIQSNISHIIPASDSERSQICDYLSIACDEDDGGGTEANGVAEFWSMPGPDPWRVHVLDVPVPLGDD